MIIWKLSTFTRVSKFHMELFTSLGFSVPKYLCKVSENIKTSGDSILHRLTPLYKENIEQNGCSEAMQNIASAALLLETERMMRVSSNNPIVFLSLGWKRVQ